MWRACATHGERHLLVVRPSETSELLLVHEGARVGSRAQQQVPYKDGITEKLFAVDHETQDEPGWVANEKMRSA